MQHPGNAGISARMDLEVGGFYLQERVLTARARRDMLLPIIKYGQPVLREPAAPVTELTGEIHQLIENMFETMYAAPGVGLAAPQVGVSLRVFVIDVSLGRDPNGMIALVNPEFVTREGVQLEDEGCLSLPGFSATVARPERVHVRGIDRTGKPREYEGKELLARAFQHEMDHLDGKVFVDRLRGIKRQMILRKIHKLDRGGKW